MSTKETGGPAFPAGAVRKGKDRPYDSGSDWIVTEKIEPSQGGMSIRDHFAAKAMQGFIACPTADNLMGDELGRWAYRIADAMLEARKS